MINKGDLKELTMVLIATAIGVVGNSAADTDMVFESGIDLSSHFPLKALVKYNSGTLTPCVIRLYCGTTFPLTIQAMGLLTSCVTGTDIYMNCQNSGAGVVGVPNSGNLVVKVVTPSTIASTFDVYFYGIKRPV